jgi:hypothetical protein
LLKGAGEDVVVSLSPPSIQIPGGLLVSQSYVKKVLVTNLSNCITTFSFGSALVDQQDDPGSENEFPVDLLDQHKQMLISVEPRSATLTAKGSIEDNDKENSLSSSIEVLVCITPLVAGRIDATLPCITGDLNNLNNNNNNGLMKRVSSNNSNVITQELVRYRSNPTSRNIGNNCVKLRIGVDAVGPRIAFNQPEVDLGLMAVLGKMSVPISFTNCGEVDCSWTMKQVESLNDSKHTHHAARNPRSSLITGKPFATLQCSPETGLLGPHETATTYVICECGHSPERLRSTLTCIIKGVDQTADAVFEPQYVSVRGEVQAPKVYLDISELNLGTCFIGVPVTRTVTLHNLSNLSTQFKWQRCLGPNPAGFHFKFEPSEGTIGEKQTLKVKFTMTAKTSGVLSELFACECHGMHRPIGFELKSSIRGVVVAYEAIDDNATSLPQPLGKPTDVQYMGSSPLPVAGIAPKFNFGDSVPLFERRIIRFAIRNLSAIACPFTIQPCRYKVSADYNPESKPSSPVIYGDNDNRQNKKKNKKNPYSSLNNHNNLHSKEIKGLYDQEVLSETGSGGGRTRSRMNSAKKNMGRLLDNRHEPKAVYQSVAGKAHIMHRIEKMEDRKVLSRRNGAAFAVSPSSGTLQPWGCVIVTVAAFNEMPGVYDDDLECVLEGALLTRLNLHMSVTGCPLKLAEDCVGLDSNTIPGKPRLQFGDILNGSPDTTKLVRIRNEGPIGARVSWSVRSPEDDGDEAMDNRFVDLSIAILPTKKTKNMKDNVKKDMASLKIKWHTRKAYTAPYSVEPSSAVIKPHSSTNFKVTLHGSAIPNNEHTDFSDLLGNINPLDKRFNQDGSTTNSSGGGGGNFESFLESDYASSAGDDDMSSQHTEDNSFAGCILDRSGTLSRIDSVGVHDGGGGGSNGSQYPS